MRRWWPWLLLVLALVPALLISKPKAPPIVTPPSRVSEAILANPRTLDPALADNPNEWAVDMNVFDTLYRLTPGGQVVGDLVSHQSISNKTITLTILPKRLGNGARLGASMVAGALSRPLWPSVGSTQARALLAAVKGVHAVETHNQTYLSGVSVVNQDTLSITLTKSVTPAFLRALANPALAIVPVEDQTHGGRYWQLTNLYGTGGYRLISWIPNGSLSFQRFSGRGPETVNLVDYSNFQEALLAFQNQAVWLVPVDPAQLDRVPGKLLPQVKALQTPGNLQLVLRLHSANIAIYPRLSTQEWVKAAFRGRIPSLKGRWPAGVRRGKPMTLYVNQSQAEAVVLADTLAHLEKGRVTVKALPESMLKSLAKGNKIGAYIGQVNWFKKGATMPLAPLRALWLVSPKIQGVRAFSNGIIDWHSIQSKS